MDRNLRFRYAERKDVSLILKFIRELAAYEKMLDEVTADEAALEEWIFDRKKAEVIFAMVDDKEIGFALSFTIFPLSWARPDFISKIYMSCLNIGETGMERPC